MSKRAVVVASAVVAVFTSLSQASAQSLTLDNIGFTDKRLVVFADIAGTQDVSDCTFKIRGSAKKSDLTSAGLGALVYTFSPINYDQFPVAGGGASGFTTKELSRRPEEKVYFRAYLTCGTFALKSNIRTLSIGATSGLQKSTVGKFLSHVKARIDRAG